MTGESTVLAATGGEEQSDHPISARDVVVRFGATTALDHFSVDIPKGVVGLLGPNGAGKSTFIKTVLGLVQPRSGQVTVAGLDARKDMLTIRDKVGYMPEHDCLIDQMTGVELVCYMGRLSGMSKEDVVPRSHEMLDFVGLGEERYRMIGSYSTGMKQRAKLAQALVHDPGILFLDEPTNGMDPLGREEILDLIGRISATDKSIIISSHILQDVEHLCREVVIVSSGRVAVQGELKALLSQGKNRKRITVRGPEQGLKSFVSRLSSLAEVLSISEEGGQATIVLDMKDGGGTVFELASEEAVQVRAFVPDRVSLEDFFIDVVREGH
jgi:ABC-2 type transport system ATP-binding protein